MTGQAHDPRADGRYYYPSPAVLRHTRSEAGQKPAAVSGASAPEAASFAGASRYESDPAFSATVRSIDTGLAAHLAQLRADKAAARRWRARLERAHARLNHFIDVELWRGLIFFITAGLLILLWTHLIWPKAIFPVGTWLLHAMGVL